MLKINKIVAAFFLFSFLILFTSSTPVLTGISFFDVDNSGSIYIFNGKEIVAFSQKLEKRNSFSNLNLGAPKSIDANDPLNIICFFETSQKVVFFDRNLTPKVNPVSAESLGLMSVTAACASYNTGFWLYNDLDKRLYRYNRFLKETNASSPITQAINSKVYVSKILETNKYLLVNDSVNGILFFDRFGTFLKLLPIKGSVELGVLDADIRILKSDTIFNYNDLTSIIDTLPLENLDYKSFKYTNDKFFLLTKSGDLSGISFRSGTR